MADKMTLEQWRVSCGLERHDLAQRVGVSIRLIHEAEDPNGLPIARVKADAICRVLSKEHGRPVAIGDIAGLKIC